MSKLRPDNLIAEFEGNSEGLHNSNFNSEIKLLPYIVGIGASAGGLEALEMFFDHMSSESGMAFVIVQHLSPDYKSMMAHILSKNTKMSLVEAEHGMPIEPNCIYLNTARTNLTIENDRLLLADAKSKSGLHLPIDSFFRSLATNCGRRAIGVILSGSGSDGSKGIIAIKESGGLVIAQDGSSAKFDGMPVSAALTGLVDFVLPPRGIAEKLLQYAQIAVKQGERQDQPLAITADQYIHLIFDRIKQESGIDFTYYKRSSILRRIERRMVIQNIESLAEYLNFMTKKPEEIQALRKDLLIGVTNFFRDAEAFDILYDRVIPAIFENKKSSREIRVWVAGCSTGEEAYSVAILLRKYADKLDIPYGIKIFATDLDKESIEYASQGIYSTSTIGHLTEEDVERFFIQDDGMYQISKEIRKMVIFAPHNITKDPPFSNLDLVTCRNMLIYLQSDMQYKVLSLFHFALSHDGFLFLGPSETIGRFTNQFEPFDQRWNIFSHKSENQKGELSVTGSGGRLTMVPSRRRTDVPVPYARESQGNKKGIDIQSILAEEHVLPAIVVDNNNDVIHLNGDVNQYLLLAKGKPSWNLYKMIDSALSVVLSTGIQKVRVERREIVYRSYAIRTNYGDRIVDITLKPLSQRHSNFGKHVIVLFGAPAEQEEGRLERLIETVDLDRSVNYRVLELEQELERAEETLQATVEELETSNEELQATNEELVAANEELQSANEELQSVNEELVTVNTEYQFKIQELTDLNNDMSNFLISTRIGTIFLDKKLCIRRFTPAITKEINLLEVDYGRPIEHISHQFKYDSLVEDAQNVLRTLMPFEKELQSKSGAWYSMRILPYRTEDNFINGVVLTFVNITDLKSSNESLVKLSYAVEQSPSMVVLTDTAGHIEYVNPAFMETTGYSPDDVQGKLLQGFVDWDSCEMPMEDIADLAYSGHTWKGEVTGRKKDGDVYRESAKLIPIKDKQGAIIHFLKLSEDMTERRQTEEMLANSEMLSAIGQLAAGIAHEIRNPLTALKGFTKLMASGNPAKGNYIGIMMDELERIEGIVSELLVLAKPQAIDLTERNIAPILQDVIMLLESQANLGNVEMELELPETGLPNILCVENQLKQVFINIVKNAIEAMQQGGMMRIKADLEDDGNKIRVNFVDSGPGIPPEKVAKMGQPFFSTKEGGTGLGLMVSKRIVENHQGRLQFHSEVGTGTTVIVTLPVS